MLYENPLMDKTKERLEDLRKERKLSFELLSKQLAERGVNISHTNLRNYRNQRPASSALQSDAQHEHRVPRGVCEIFTTYQWITYSV